jgi:3-phytase
MPRPLLIIAGLAAVCLLPRTPAPPTVVLKPIVETESVVHDADDPAIWVNPDNPERSLIVATDKGDSKLVKQNGALYVFDLNGKTLSQTPVDRPDNVDVQDNFLLDGKATPIAVTAERRTGKLRIFAIEPNGNLRDITGKSTKTFAGQAGTMGQPMGIGLYRRPSDGTVFAILTRVKLPKQGALWQYRLQSDGNGRVNAVKVRTFGNLIEGMDTEAVAVDDELGYVYYAEEDQAIHKWHADPDHPDAKQELATFATEGWTGDREGIGIYAHPDGTGYIVCTDQIEGSSRYTLFRREGESGKPHDHSQPVQVLIGGADDTDGIETISASLGSRFPQGVLIAMNSKGKNFLIYDWRDILKP